MRPSPRVLVCVPVGATRVKTSRNSRICSGAGAREVFLIEKSQWLRLSVQACLFLKTTSSMVVDIGGGTTEVAVISLNGVVLLLFCAYRW